MTMPEARRFLFLQGPHGPFFFQLGRMLERAGAEVWRVGFNGGDRAFWFAHYNYIPFRDHPEAWPDTFRRLVADKAITDIVLYGDVRPVHAEAVAAARDLGLTVHVFEEGYMRPYWVTYERGGSNGHSRLMEMTVREMRHALEMSDLDVPEPPARWGDMKSHMAYGALYHWFLLFRSLEYRNFRRHRDLPVLAEAMLYTRGRS